MLIPCEKISANMRASSARQSSLRPLLIPVSVCVVLGFAASTSAALTLGNVRGAVLVGRPLNVIMPVQLDAGDAASAVCTEVEIFYADNRLEGGRVRSGWLAPEAKSEGLLRIETTLPVDEPVVSVQVRAGCVRKSVRKYVLLADVPVEAAQSSLASGSTDQAAGSASGNSVVLLGRDVPEGGATENATAVPPMENSVVPAMSSAVKSVKAVRRPAATAESVPKASAPKVKPQPLLAVKASVPSGVVASKSRLKLESSPEINTSLKSSLELVTPLADNEQARAEAKAVWRSLNALPEELAHDAKRLQALETEVKAMQSNVVKNQQTQEAVKTQLAKSEGERYSNALVGVLAALLLCALTAVGYLWFRLKGGRFGAEKDWWRSQSAEPSILSDLAEPEIGGRHSVRGKDVKNGKNGKPSRSPDIDLGADESLFNDLKVPPAIKFKPSRWQLPSDSVPPRSGFFNSSMSARAVSVEELFDIQQQAEFFVSLGQHDQAIDLLQQHIFGATSTSGLAYLDLLQLYHQFNRREEYGDLREEFNRAFNAKVPTFDNYTHQGRGIERNSAVVQRLQAHWKLPDILDVLNGLIFRKSEAEDDQGDAFDLTAYRELMLLFAIAKDMAEGSPGVTELGHDERGAQLDAMAARSPGTSQIGSSLGGSQHHLSAESMRIRSSALTTPSLSKHDALDVRSASLDVVRNATTPPNVPEVTLPRPSPRLGLDVDLFELESVMAALDDVAHRVDFSLSGLDLPTPSPSQSAPSPVVASGPVELDIEKYLKNDSEFLSGSPGASKVPKTR